MDDESRPHPSTASLRRAAATALRPLADTLRSPAGAAALRAMVGVTRRLVTTYCRLEIDVREPLPEGPALVVSHHGFGGIVDLNVAALLEVLDRYAPGPWTILTHDVAWTLGAGPLVEAAGARPASRRDAEAALAQGHLLAVLPGGDLDAAKPFSRRHQVDFFGAEGFAHLALEQRVPVVPVVTAGAGESLLVLSDGRALAEALQLPRLLRCRALPISVSIPWGVNVGLVGLIPYLPLPTKLRTAVLPTMTAAPGEDAGAFADRIQVDMQSALDDLTAHRRPVLG